MKALVIHPWKGLSDTFINDLQWELDWKLGARGVEVVFLELKGKSTAPEASEELLKRVFELEYGDIILWHGGSYPEVINLASYAMRTLAPAVSPKGLPMYHFMPYELFVSLQADAWSTYCNNERILAESVESDSSKCLISNNSTKVVSGRE